MVSQNTERLKWMVQSLIREAENRMEWWKIRINVLEKMLDDIEDASKRKKSDHDQHSKVA